MQFCAKRGFNEKICVKITFIEEFYRPVGYALNISMIDSYIALAAFF